MERNGFESGWSTAKLAAWCVEIGKTVQKGWRMRAEALGKLEVAYRDISIHSLNKTKHRENHFLKSSLGAQMY